jgi:hypothetical protein
MQINFQVPTRRYRGVTSCLSIAVIIALGSLCIPANRALGQSTASVQGTITDSTGATVEHAKIVAHNVATGEERSTESDSAGTYALPSLSVGTYTLTISSQGLQTILAKGILLEVGQVAAENFSLHVASKNEEVEVTATPSLITTETTTVGAIIAPKMVQEIPLNGRHFTDLGFLIPGSFTPPQNATLAAPLRGQGFFGFNTAGGREDTINLMVNGINLDDFGGGNQITFQPTLGTIQEFKVENSTFRAEYGFRSGAIVNMTTRTGTNQWHGEIYDYLRNNDLDARNYENQVTQPMAPFHRNQFGANGGGPIQKDKTFIYLSYEGLRHLRGVPLSATVLSNAQRAQVMATSDSVIQSLLSLIPVANSSGDVYESTANAPVVADQGTVNFSRSFPGSNEVNVYYAYQAD